MQRVEPPLELRQRVATPAGLLADRVDQHDRQQDGEHAGRRPAEQAEVGSARQVLAEAKWLVHDTADFDRAERRLRDLRARLAAPAEPHDGGQLAEDGSFGCCTEEWFLKLDNTVDELITLGLRLRSPEHPVRLLERVNSPEKLRALVKAGMDVARLNLSHGSYADHEKVYEEVRKASDESGRAVGVS